MQNQDPAISEQSEAIDAEFDALVEQFLATLRQGEDVSVSGFADLHPNHAERLRQLLPTLISLEACGRAKNSPVDVAPTSIGEYHIIRLLGRGGMGVVYLAEHPRLQRQVAIKILPRHLTNDSSILKRFQREANAIAMMEHPNVVTLFELGHEPARTTHESDLNYFVMKYVEGVGLDVVIRQHRARDQRFGDTVRANFSATIPATSAVPSSEIASTARPQLALQGADRWKTIAQIGRDVADGLAHAHSREILHRDIKPSNLIIDQSGKAWITDFGLAKLADDEGTATNGFAGTLRFMAPERFRGWADPRSDIYSLGATLYELATLHPAVDGSERAEILSRITAARIVPPRQLVSNMPRDLETITLNAMSCLPDERYQTAGELRDDLQRFLEHEPIVARPSSPVESSRKWIRRNPIVAGLVAVLTVVLLVATVGSSIAAWSFSDLANELKKEKDTATRSLLLAHIGEAHAHTTSNRPGQRLRALDAIENAVALLPIVHHEEGDVLQLRNEMIAALALPDVELTREIKTEYSISLPSPNFKFFASSMPDGGFQLCDAQTGDVLWSYQFQGGSINSTSANCFSPDSRYVVAFSHGASRLRLFDCESGEVLMLHQAKAIDPLQPVAFDGQSSRLAICSHNSPIRIFSLHNLAAPPLEIAAEIPVVRAFFYGDDTLVGYHPEENRGDLVVHKFSTGETSVVSTWVEDAVCWTPGADALFVGSARGIRARVDWPDTSQVLYASIQTPQARQMELNMSAGLLASNSWGEGFHIADSETGNGHFSLWGEHAKFSKDGQWLALDDSRSLRYFRIHSNRDAVSTTAAHHNIGDHGLRLDRFGKLMLTTSGLELQLWDAEHLRLLDSYRCKSLGPAVCFMSDDKVAGVIDGQLSSLDIIRNDGVIQLGKAEPLAPAFENWFSIAADSDTIAWQTPTGSIKVGEMSNLNQAVEFRPRVAATHPYFELSPDGKRLALADGTIRLFNAETGTLVHDFGSQTQGTPRTYFEFRTAGHELLCHTGSEQLIIDLQQNRVIKRFPTRGYLCGAEWSNDGRMLARVVDSETIHLLNADTYEELATLRLAEPLGIRTVRFSRDGSALLACVKASQIHRWNLAAIRRELVAHGLDW